MDGGSLSSDTDTDRLLQDVDIGRLRAVVFRDMVRIICVFIKRKVFCVCNNRDNLV